MKIAHIVDSLQVGGAEMLVAQLCRVQQAAGHTAVVYCLFDKGPVADLLAAQGIPVWFGGSGRFQRYRGIWRLVREFRPDVAHCHNRTATVEVAPLARLGRVRTVISTRHGLVPPEQHNGQERKFWLAARFCNYVVAVCQAAHDNLSGAPGAIAAKLVTVRNGAAVAGRSDARPERNGFTLINVARLHAVKDHATLLEAVAKVREQAPDVSLRIVGDGPLRGELEALAARLGIQDRVSFLGERKDVGVWLEASDLFVISSVSEGLPLSIVEAMAAGLPLVVTRVGGMPEMVELAGGGMVVAPRDANAMAAAILELRRRGAELSRLGDANRRAYAESLTLEKMAAAYERLYAGG